MFFIVTDLHSIWSKLVSAYIFGLLFFFKEEVKTTVILSFLSVCNNFHCKNILYWLGSIFIQIFCTDHTTIAFLWKTKKLD